jgi:O-methyltransferase involved in polyketide biosynthesis
MALRTRYFDRQVKLFAEKYPECTIINLGCGFDSRHMRVDNGKMKWFDLDLPEVISLKKGYFNETARYKMLGYSVLDYTWMDAVLPFVIGKVMIIVEGLFMYLDETKAKELIVTLRNRFPTSEFLVEMARKYWVNKMNSAYLKWKFKHQLGFSEDSMFRFGIDSASDIEILDQNIRLMDEWSYFDDREKRLGWFNLLGRFDKIRKVQWTLHFTLG